MLRFVINCLVSLMCIDQSVEAMIGMPIELINNQKNNLVTVSVSSNELENPDRIMELVGNFQVLEIKGIITNEKQKSGLEDLLHDELKVLTLDNLKLKHLPESIGQLNNLKELNCRGNDIDKFPQMITKLQQLEKLDISDNNIQTVPISIFKLKNLHVLNIQGNKLKKFPHYIFQLPSLRELVIDRSLVTFRYRYALISEFEPLIKKISVNKIKTVSGNNSICLELKKVWSLNKIKLSESQKFDLFKVAIKQENLPSMACLVNMKVDFNRTDKKGLYLLHLAVHTGNLSVVSFILNEGVDFYCKDKEGNNVLHLAARNRLAPMLRYLINYMFMFRSYDIIDVPNDQGETPLMIAVCENDISSVDVLITNGANVMRENKFGWTALSYAYALNYKDIVHLIEDYVNDLM